MKAEEDDDTVATQESMQRSAAGAKAQPADAPEPAAKQQGGQPAAGRPAASSARPSALYGYVDAARSAALSPHMQGALQIGCGLFIAGLFTFVRWARATATKLHGQGNNTADYLRTCMMHARSGGATC